MPLGMHPFAFRLGFAFGKGRVLLNAAAGRSRAPVWRRTRGESRGRTSAGRQPRNRKEGKCRPFSPQTSPGTGAGPVVPLSNVRLRRTRHSHAIVQVARVYPLVKAVHATLNQPYRPQQHRSTCLHCAGPAHGRTGVVEWVAAVLTAAARCGAALHGRRSASARLAARGRTSPTGPTRAA